MICESQADFHWGKKMKNQIPKSKKQKDVIFQHCQFLNFFVKISWVSRIN
jgi:hypothetical protein